MPGQAFKDQAHVYLEELQAREFLATGIRQEVPDEEFHEWFLEKAVAEMGPEGEAMRDQFEYALKQARENNSSRWEDPLMFNLMSELFDDVEAAAEIQGLALPERPVFGTLPIRRVNAMAIGVPSTTEVLITFQVGIFGFMNLATKAFAAALPVAPEPDENGHIGFSLEEEQVAAHLASDPGPVARMGELLAAYVYTGDPHEAEQYFLKGPAQALATIFRNTGERFVLGHEYGHLVGGHVTGTAAAFTDEGPIEVDGPGPAWVEEFEADSIGFRLAVQAAVGEGFDLALSYAGVDLTFTAFELVERALAVARFGDVGMRATSDTHPPPAMRREMLRYTLAKVVDAKEQVEGTRQMAASLELVGDMMWAAIEPRLQSMHEGTETPSLIWGAADDERAVDHDSSG